jgi:hypothetical protein
MLAVISAYGQQQVRQGHPKLTYQDTVYNFGTIKKGAEVEAVFSLTNTGDVPVLMNKVKPSCEAITVISYPYKPIFPGQQQEIRVKFNSKKICQGAKYITVETTEIKSFRTLTLKGEVK